MLEVKNLSASYGRINILRDVNLEVKAGEIVTLIGANGAGKSTLLKCIAGLLRPTSGEVFFNGARITGWSGDRVVRKGLALVPEGRQVFGNLSVYDNLLLGTYGQVKRAGREQVDGQLKEVFTLFPRLEERINQRANTLSGGEQQMLAISRALMARPRLLMMDEPSLGLAPLVVQNIFQIITDLNQKGIPILLIEQNARAALAISHRAYVMENGGIVMAGDARSILEDSDIRHHYLGVRS